MRDGDALKHQQDLRARTLPLMRRKEEFGRINAAAIKYFGDRKMDPRQRGEWIYHRLLGGESPESVEKDLTDAVVHNLKDAHEDFVKGSPGGGLPGRAHVRPPAVRPADRPGPICTWRSGTWRAPDSSESHLTGD